MHALLNLKHDTYRTLSWDYLCALTMCLDAYRDFTFFPQLHIVKWERLKTFQNYQAIVKQYISEKYKIFSIHMQQAVK